MCVQCCDTFKCSVDRVCVFITPSYMVADAAYQVLDYLKQGVRIFPKF